MAGMVVNLSGFNEPGGVTGTASAAYWLFLLFAIAPLLALFTAWRAAKIRLVAE
ncbi:unnamed protein product [Photorhabdus laumondii subsp. laumondii TTO1]|uniref:Photorhabdus luminescens subsp. laumondii TTO1 complete genome segment 17/17 n=1 Tax=Photorhabdus laumondii subsp. laumondii (strain DSM 15139 / CIP 105565 / TT01) TaxID=243265 RepID=Q7MY15_PHOLL|nr:unnamed protein product [Photorhabdus laumondii subsp. laumondii TTO1]